MSIFQEMEKYCFRNLVFEGGGVKGIAYAGALEILEKKGCMAQIKKVAGTSAGAISATLVALNYSSKEIENILRETNFSSFKDGSIIPFLDYRRLYKKYGLYKGKAFEKWFSSVIAMKYDSDITFKQLSDLANKGKEKLLYVIGADLSSHKEIVYSHESTPNTKIKDAVRISMSIPLFFQAIRQGDSVLVDGGIYYNYPINLFDKSGFTKETLGLRVDKTSEIVEEFTSVSKPKEINDFKSYVKTLIGGLVDLANKRHLSEADWHRTIYIDCKNISSTDFDLSEKDKQFLIDSGKLNTIRYFEWYDKPKGKKPLNK